MKTTQPNTSNANTCMHKHVAKPYDDFYLMKNFISLYFMSTKIQN